MKSLLLTFFLSAFTSLLWAQSVTPVGAPFQNGGDMVFDFAGSADATDWIGIYNVGDVPGNTTGTVASIVWQYANGSGQTASTTVVPSGTVTFDGILANGDYEVHILCCDGYTIMSSASFSVTGATPASIAATTYPVAGQTVTFNYTGSTGNPLDWIGIYAAGAVPGTDGSLMFQYVPGAEGSLTFDDPAVLVPGNYDAHLFCCDDYIIYASTNFTVYEALAPSLSPVGAPAENQPLTFAFTGGSGSVLDWVGIYPTDSIPGVNGTSISYLYVTGANGEVTFDPIPELVPGTFYDAHLLKDDGYEIIASYTNWTVVVTGTGEIKLVKPVFSAQPSPAHEVVRLVFTERVAGKVTFFNMVGQAVRSEAVNGEETLEVRGIQPGNYAVQFQGEKGSQVIKVVVE